MQKKITDIFANLLRGRRDGDDDEHAALLLSQAEQQRLEETIRSAFKGLKWTRLVSLQKWEPMSCRAWDLGTDIIYELQQINEIDTGELEHIEPVFDPLVF